MLPQNSHENQVACYQSAKLMDLLNFWKKRLNASFVQVFSIFFFLFILLFANLYKHSNGSNFQINDF